MPYNRQKVHYNIIIITNYFLHHMVWYLILNNETITMNVTSEAVQAMEDVAKKTVEWNKVTNRKWNSKDKDQCIRSLLEAPSDVIAN